MQMTTNPTKSYDLVGFLLFGTVKTFINSQIVGDKFGYPKSARFRVTEFFANSLYTGCSENGHLVAGNYLK